MTLPGFPDAAPLAGLAGGVLIGLSAALMLLGAGRVTGISGIVARAFGISDSGMSYSSAWTFVIGLPIGAALVTWLTAAPTPEFMPLPLLAVAGVLVGFGARLGSGCTSGHGVCGVSRLSQRSLVATTTFITAGIATVAAMGAFS
ncbi:YeeE/YedE family protein [Qipengyuania aquimaris]|uniref:YeeE/YedE family protein n=1 Tax=Qipengyuania aquimaris TaxID=255984 RepID=A0A9Q3S2B3_9SPHN|nr:YeeE/YedE thiosulfate transporter family protein [Qipengyuania aquimaris]MBY6218761.1 YeeE/YedE family protein [Qipengyuania aquimaris]